MTISLIVAASTNNAIGKNNQLLWHLPTDLKFFKNTTWAMPVIMGRKTFEAIGSKPLPGRTNIIISRSRQPESSFSNVLFALSLDESIQLARQTNAKEIFIAGGAQIYELAMPLANRIYMTRVHAHFDADAYFPEYNVQDWDIKQNTDFLSDEKHAYSFSIQCWEKKEL
ncbi:MAG: dihydrofolate reductase [Lacibacter sp.]|jgi:dihydrofolate reductase